MKFRPSSFTYVYDGVEYSLDLTRRPKHTSREACGVWEFGDNRAWKIFSSMGLYRQLTSDYETARANGVPTPDFSFVTGVVASSNGQRRSGFALVSTYVASGRFFALKRNNTSQFKRAIDSIVDDGILQEIERALAAAVRIRLADPQGFIDPTNAYHPVVFIDIHTHSVPAGSLESLQDYVLERRRKLLEY